MRKIYKDRRLGVTLFELLVVVLVLLILTSIFVLSSKRVLITSKISKVREEHSVLTQAISHYQVDYNTIPPLQVGLDALKETTKYVTSLPSDPFISSQPKNYLYITNPSSNIKYILVSAGPDGDLDILPFVKQVYQQPYITAEARDSSFHSYIDYMSYDPTNGIGSNGDLLTIVPAN